MTDSIAKAPEGMHTITPHIVVSDANSATDWYRQVLGAEERGRIEVPGGKVMQVELWFGDSAVMLADEFPELGVLSPLSVGGRTFSGASATVRSPTPSATAGALRSTCAVSRVRRLPAPSPQCSASTSMFAATRRSRYSNA